ncbi:hypothetical protein [Ralstonia pickettii]|uniref:hypothetical protein n=1 Tax=Ralstonia pickettii TaxID=329 RepID=UPI0015F9FB0E|nr:hypothetical protein [Ralstonia pickettii]MBX4004324.1 hypothetical protein [Ralstonia pickettii]MBX4028147.1 hypothetical protein [Ralstonia pickettii]MBX4072760.1 hypothetical protein [Ralstonia pickettii]MBX4077717.1 hypothetical protein [Ralstonia pickettii]MBX4090722.1 hypothetical protein [Ralstonia pickettii]
MSKKHHQRSRAQKLARRTRTTGGAFLVTAAARRAMRSKYMPHDGGGGYMPTRR